ncbi:MAG TPA: OmpA family protein [candidate division Zixibacteria bacterium]|nr:OmpA family protein [candidate division Zixibacteria bacterium]
MPRAPARDADADGVLDSEDSCLATPLGAIVDRYGCPLDEDGDGIYDGLDRCPGTAPEDAMNVDAVGCPIPSPIPYMPYEQMSIIPGARPAADSSALPPEAETSLVSADGDSDGDGVLDSQDWCPGTLRGLPVDRYGCLVMTQLQRRLILHVSYLPGTSAPDRTSLSVLDDLIARLKKVPHVHATVEGFTDNIGLEADNLAVSQKRADHIKAYMVRHGIAAERITAIGRGETKFIGDNDTRAGRQKNRRIEISFHVP